jgi:hypothetical protein
MKGLPSSPFKRKRGHSCDVTRHNRQFIDWARRDSPAAVEESAATAAAPEPYIPDNQALALLQSAYDEFIESRGIAELPFDPNDPGWITIAEEKQKAAARPKHPFISHKDAGSFRYDLPADAAVVLFADWGTGEPTAQRVMAAGRRRASDACHPSRGCLLCRDSAGIAEALSGCGRALRFAARHLPLFRHGWQS